MEVSSARARFLTAAMTTSSGVTDGLVRYSSTQNLSSSGCRQPEFLTPIVFGGHAEDKRLFAVFCIGLTFVWFVMYKGLHPDWNKWMFVVAVMVIDVRIGR